MIRLKYLSTLILIFHIIALAIIPAKISAAADVNLQLDVKSAILMEASTGQILYAVNADEALRPASMAKMMTEYLVIAAIKSGQIKWDDIVTTSKKASSIIGSGQLLAHNEKLSVRDMFSAMSIYSGNDATVALAEFVAGSEANFVKKMNQAAQDLGLTNSYFVNATGLNKADLGEWADLDIPGETVMSARDAAELARVIVNEHSEVLELASITSQKLRPKDASPMINWNWMLAGNKSVKNFEKYAYEGLDGLKTGYTLEAGDCFTGTAMRNGMRLITVVMGTTSKDKRFGETRKLLDYGFNSFEVKTIIQAKTELTELPLIAVKKGVQTEVSLVTSDGVQFVVSKSEPPTILIEITEADEVLRTAPIEEGTALGTAKVSYNSPTGTISKTISLITSEDVEKGNWFRLFFRAFKNFFGDMFSSIASGIKGIFG